MEQAGALRSAAWALLRGGHFDQACDYLDRAQALADRHDDPRAVADIHSLRGALHFQMEEWQAASVAYWHSLAGYEPIHDRLGMATAHLGLGKSFYALGEFPRALPHMEEALKLFRGLKLDRDTARAEALVVQLRRVLGPNAPAPEAPVEVIDPYTTLQADVPRAAPPARPARPAGRARP
jgi:tetratricopeptide (TPR) repeat protein